MFTGARCVLNLRYQRNASLSYNGTHTTHEGRESSEGFDARSAASVVRMKAQTRCHGRCSHLFPLWIQAHCADLPPRVAPLPSQRQHFCRTMQYTGFQPSVAPREPRVQSDINKKYLLWHCCDMRVTCACNSLPPPAPLQRKRQEGKKPRGHSLASASFRLMAMITSYNTRIDPPAPRSKLDSTCASPSCEHAREQERQKKKTGVVGEAASSAPLACIRRVYLCSTGAALTVLAACNPN